MNGPKQQIYISDLISHVLIPENPLAPTDATHKSDHTLEQSSRSILMKNQSSVHSRLTPPFPISHSIDKSLWLCLFTLLLLASNTFSLPTMYHVPIPIYIIEWRGCSWVSTTTQLDRVLRSPFAQWWSFTLHHSPPRARITIKLLFPIRKLSHFEAQTAACN